MSKQIPLYLSEAQQLTEEAILQYPLWEAQCDQIHALEVLARQILPLFNQSLSGENGSPNALAERCIVVPASERPYNAEQYAQKCVLACPDLFPFFTQLVPDLSNSFEQVIDQTLKGSTDLMGLGELTDAADLLTYIMPNTTDALEMLIDKIEKRPVRREGCKRYAYSVILKKCHFQDPLAEYVFNNPNASEALISQILKYKLGKEQLEVSKICALLSRYTEARGWGSMPSWFEPQILSIENLVYQREALTRFDCFLENECNRFRGSSFERMTLFLKNPLLWLTYDMPDSILFWRDDMIQSLAVNETSREIAQETFHTFTEEHALNELMRLSEDAKLFLLLLSLAPTQGVSKEMCDALLKHVCPPSQKGKDLTIYSMGLFRILQTKELDPADKHYLLSRILKEPDPLSCMRMIHAIYMLEGFAGLKKMELEQSTVSDLMWKILQGDKSFIPAIKAQARKTETDPLAEEIIAEILNVEGFKKEEARDANYERKKNQTIAEVQGCTSFCEKTLHYAQEKPSVLSPASLRTVQTVTGLVLRLKRFGHAYNLEGMIPLPNETQANLEGFNETFVIPMLRDMFEEFACHRPDLVSPYARDFVKEALSKAVWHDNASEERIQETHKLIHDPDYDYPVVVGSGWVWHSTQAIFYMGNLYYINRGADCNGRPGVTVYNIEKPEKITPEFLKRLASRLSVDHPDYMSLEKIKEELRAFETQYKPMKEQKVGNCVYVNAKAAISTLLLIGSLKENSQGDAKQVYKAFSQFDKEAVLEDFLIDIEGAGTGNVWEGHSAVADIFENWALVHRGKNQKISTDLSLKALSLFYQKRV